MLKPRIGCYAVYEAAEEDWQNHEQQLAHICADLTDAGTEVIAAPEPVYDEASCRRVAAWFADKHVDVLHPVVINWSFDHYSVMIYQHREAPLAVRSIPGIRTGSIVGGVQLGCLLSDLSIEHKLLYGPLGSRAVAAETAQYAKACMLKNRLKGTRFAVVGARTPGMTPVAVDEVEILRLFGISLINLGWEDLMDRARRIDASQAEDHWRSVSAAAAAVSCSEAHGIAAMQNYLAMKQLIEEYRLQGLTIGAYPRCQGTACLGLALLNDAGIPAGCEGDVNSTIVMYMLGLLSHHPVHFGEILAVDETENSIITSHCGAAAPSLADESGYSLCPVRLAHSGTCVRFTCRTGPITYVNLVGRKGNYRMCAVEGDALPTGMVFEGNPLKIRLHTPFGTLWETISTYGFGSHWMAAYEHVARILSEFCRMSGIHGVFPDKLRVSSHDV